ncbi:MAG: GC-type dockerin domain-anchored protein [Phycisphaerales bacterium]
MRSAPLALVLAAGLCASAFAQSAAVQGPSTLVGPYVIPSDPAAGVKVVSIATNGDNRQVNGVVVAPDETHPLLDLSNAPTASLYRLLGTPDGMGAFRDADDMANGTFTIVLNHEIVSGAGTVRAHGAAGSTVSIWKIRADPNNLQVIGGRDLIQTVKTYSAATHTWSTATYSFGRFCSADLAAPSAYRFGELGTDTRIYLNGEESGNEGKVWAHLVNGPEAGTSYELPHLGKFSVENSAASPYAQEKTVVLSGDDSTPGNVLVYVGTKTSTGNDIERAGLTNGKFYSIAIAGTAVVAGQHVEDATNILGDASSGPVASKRFTMIDMNDVSAMTGVQIQSTADAAGQMNFNRPEDICWDRRNPNVAYFQTTASITGHSRIWKMEFDSIAHPENGGTVTMLVDGAALATTTAGFTSATGLTDAEMFDNMTITRNGIIVSVEDVGNAPRLGRTWMYDTKTDRITEVGTADPTRFISGSANFLTQDEEASGIIDAEDVLGPGWFLLDMQAHYTTTFQGLVEGGQLMAMYIPAAVQRCEADLGGPGGVAVADGYMNNNDFIAFITLFFAQDHRADLGQAGGVAGSDNNFDNNDFVSFINIFFSDCGF